MNCNENKTTTKKSRIQSLDWLRGLMAISIMVYHLTYWNYGTWNSDSILGRLGLYGVTIFFILSGLSMAMVYNRYIIDFRTSLLFFMRRIFRIWPLLFLSCFLVLFTIDGPKISWKAFLFTGTTLFGFIRPSVYIVTGGWSIGNEMVYYAFTPLVIYLYNRSNLYGNIFFFIAFIIGMIFPFLLLKSSRTLADQFNIYINPFNNFWIYISGIALFFNLRNLSIKPYINNSLLILFVLLFIYYPVNGDQIELVIGVNRIIFSFIAIGIVLWFWKLYLSNFRWWYVILEKFGLATYGIYLLHPIITSLLSPVIEKIGIFNVYVKMLLIACVTISISLFTYYFFEKKFLDLGKKLTNQNGFITKLLTHR
jgi:exopolysaccharide production protein ExoZ